jgi:hypothetical protein
MNVKLLRKVAKHILANPQRLLMEDWVRHFIEGEQDEVYYGFDCDKERPFPSCGTVACIAGWTCEIGAKYPKRIKDHARVAQRLLGLGKRESLRLFVPSAWPNQFHAGCEDDGTPETAKLAVARIEHFIKTKGRE